MCTDFVIGAVRILAERYSCQSVLDYGCGKGHLARHITNLPMQLYDPGIPMFSAAPEPADMVVCTAMLEHVEFMSLYPVLNDLERLTKKIAFITVSTIPSSKILADGRNAHLVVKPIDWWITGLAQRWLMKSAENYGSWFYFLGKKKG